MDPAIMGIHEVKSAADGSVGAQSQAGYHRLVESVHDDQLRIEMFDPFQLIHDLICMLHAEDKITLEQPFCDRISKVKVFSGIPREIIDHDRFSGCLGDLLIVGIDLFRAKTIIKRRRGRNRVKAQLHGAAGIFLSFFHGNRPYMGDQVRALRKL